MENEDNKLLIRSTSSKNKIYKLFEGNEFLTGGNAPHLKHTFSNGKESVNSLQFDADCLRDVFGLNCKNFCKKYTEAISGLEEDNIFTIHSSSLLALLFFCGVSPENSINIYGKDYNYVHFEHKNPIPFSSKNRNYTTHSNIDVVLSDEETLEKSKNILFLESKFTEYTHNAQESGISLAAYGNIYEALSGTLDKMGLIFNNGILSRKTKEDKEHYYCEGIKQMICHFMGARNFAKKYSQKNITLGSIIYDLRVLDSTNDSKYKNMVTIYSSQYNTLMEGIIEGSKNGIKELKVPERLTLITDILTYQNVFEIEKNKNYEINDKVRQFYRLKK